MDVHPLALILEISQMARRYVEVGLAAHDLTFNQHNMLQLLRSRDYVRPSTAASLLSINRPTATVIIDNLEKKGWIERVRDPENRRNVRVCLTLAGREKAEATYDWVLEVKGSLAPLLGLSEEEVRRLSQALEQVKTSVSQQLASLEQRLAAQRDQS